MKEDFEKILIRGGGPSSLARRIASLLLPSALVTTTGTSDEQIQIGCSKFGNLPDLSRLGSSTSRDGKELCAKS